MSFILANLYLILTVCAVLHVFEEFVYPGGFAKNFKPILSEFGLIITNFQILLINTLFFSLIFIVLFWHNELPLIALSAIFLVGINGILHVLTSIRLHRYFPGLITGALLYIPLSVITYLNVHGDFKLKALLLALALHAVPFIVILTGKLFTKK